MIELLHISEEAQKNISLWMEGNYDPETKQEIEYLAKHDPKELENAFYQNLTFGTAGLRGLMGVGPNRMNIYTVHQTTKGLATYIKQQYPNTPLRVAIAYDSRHNSQKFATVAAQVLAECCIEVFLCKHLRPTPLVSFACRHLNCHAAIMITASHNPPEYNGYKVYWSDGGQILSPHDQGITLEIEKARQEGIVRVAPQSDPYIHTISKEIDEEYLAAIKPLELWPDNDKSSLSILYSSLHGTGATLIPQALQQIKCTNLHLLQSQIIPDGSFPTIKTPNPENREALQLGIDEMLEKKYDLFLATDPDADRIGVVVNHHGTEYILNGNQIASIAAEWIFSQLSSQGKLPENPMIVKSIVTTPLIQKIAHHWKGRCQDVLTGFKYIAQKMQEWESDSHNFIFGCEESYGCLFGTHAHDKDAVVAACIISEIAWHAKQQEKTLVDLLNDMWTTYGYFNESVINCAFGETKEGRLRMTACMDRLRSNPPTAFADIKVTAREDLLIPKQNSIHEKLPKADVLLFTLEDESLIIFRPSGTEPKIKVYIMLSPPKAKILSDAKKQSAQKEKQFTTAIQELL